MSQFKQSKIKHLCVNMDKLTYKCKRSAYTSVGHGVVVFLKCYMSQIKYSKIKYGEYEYVGLKDPQT